MIFRKIDNNKQLCETYTNTEINNDIKLIDLMVMVKILK